MTPYELLDKEALATRSALALLNLLDHDDDVQFWIKDRAGIIQWTNKALIRQYAESGGPDALRGCTDYDLEPKALAEQARLDDACVLAGTPVIDREELGMGPDHLLGWFITTKLPIYTAEGAIVGTIGMSRPRDPKASGLLESGLLKVLEYVRQNYSARPDNSVLARVFGKTEAEMDGEFFTHIKMTPQDYVRRVCVRLACRDLVNAEMSFDQIAIKHGFGSHERFAKEFEEEMGSTPRVYRMNLFNLGAVRVSGLGGS